MTKKLKQKRKYKSRYQLGGVPFDSTAIGDSLNQGSESSSVYNLYKQNLNRTKANEEQALLKANQIKELELVNMRNAASQRGIPSSVGPRMFQAGGMHTDKKRVKKYAVGGMYADNTVGAAGQGLKGSTSHIVFDESNPAVLQQKMDFLTKTKEDAITSSGEMALSLEQQEQLDQEKIAAAAAESKNKFAKGESIVKGGLEKGTKLIDKLKTLKSAKDVSTAGASTTSLSSPLSTQATQLSAGTLGTGTVGTGLQNTLGTGALGTGTAPASLIDKSSSLFKPFTPNPALMGDKLSLGTSLSKSVTPTLANSASTVGSKFAFNRSFDAATGVTSGGFGVGNPLLTKGATTAVDKGGSLVGAAANTGMAGAGPIGIASALGGAALKHWGGDDDDTELNAAEWGGELLEGAGTGIGVAGLASGVVGAMGAGALWGSAVPGLGTAIGAVAGLGYGAYKAITGRKEARQAERKAKHERKVKVDKYNKELTGNLLSARAQARAGEQEQKTYSGYDLGRNVTAKYGGMRYAKGGMRMGVPRYGYAA